MKTTILATLILLLCALPLRAQDRQFWDQAVGAKTGLLGGLAIAGVRDYGATFYNPGAMSFVSKTKMNFNFNMYGVKDFSFINGGGPGIDSRYTRVSLYPASLAGPLSFLGDSLNRFSYMIYANGYSYVRISERFEGYADVIPTRPSSVPGAPKMFEGNEFLINQGKIDMLLSEVSVGFGYSRKISHNVGVGVTLIGAYRDQTKERLETYSAYDTLNQRTATTDLYVDVDYWAVRFSLKFGIAAEWEKLKFGATVTTPSVALKVASGGTDGASLTSNNVYFDPVTNAPIDIIASDRQEGLPVNYRSPFSIAAGIEYQLSDETSLHFAAEWFAPITTYVVIQPESDEFILNNPASITPQNSAVLLKVRDSMKPVFNAGIGVEHKLSEKFTGYAAVRTDFSNANYGDIKGLAVGFTDFDIYHYTLGVSTHLNDTFIGVGLEYSHGARADFPQIFNFPSGAVAPEDIAIPSNRGTCRVLYNNFNVFFGVTQLL